MVRELPFLAAKLGLEGVLEAAGAGPLVLSCGLSVLDVELSLSSVFSLYLTSVALYVIGLAGLAGLVVVGQVGMGACGANGAEGVMDGGGTGGGCRSPGVSGDV